MVERKREEFSHFYTAAVGEFQCFDGYACNIDLEMVDDQTPLSCKISILLKQNSALINVLGQFSTHG